MLDDSEGGSAAGGESSCLSVDFPMPFKEAVDFNMNEGVGPIKDESADLQALHTAHSRVVTSRLALLFCP